MYAREQEGSTGIGEGIAIPHCKSDAVIKPGLAAMVVKDGVEFESLDGQPAHLFFLIAAPNTEDNVHLDVLSRLSVLLMDEDFTNKLRQAASVSELSLIHILFTSEAPHGVVKNSVGAGDSMVAGFLAGYLAKGDYAEAFKMGLCTGSASAFSDQLATREEVEQVRRSHIFDF